MPAEKEDILSGRERSVDKALLCDHSDESYWAVLSYGTVNYAVQGGSNFTASG